MTIKASTANAFAVIAALTYSKAWGVDEADGCITLTETWKEGDEVVQTVTHHYGEDVAPLLVAAAETEAKRLEELAAETKAHNEAGTNKSGEYIPPDDVAETETETITAADVGDVTIAIGGTSAGGVPGNVGG